MRILLTNDDGIDAPGLWAMYDAITHLGEVHVVAPASVQSATSHAVTFHQPIRVCRHRGSAHRDGATVCQHARSVEGRPADCVKLAVQQLVPGPIDLVVSGMNAGANVGLNVIYSGTVGAAREAAFLGIPAMAVSLHLDGAGNGGRPIQWQAAAHHARQVIDRLLARQIQPHTVMNINVPILDEGPPHGVKVVPVATTPNLDAYDRTSAGEDAQHYQIANSMAYDHHPPNTDLEAIYQRYITVSPLHFDVTLHEQLADWRQHLQIELDSR